MIEIISKLILLMNKIINKYNIFVSNKDVLETINDNKYSVAFCDEVDLVKVKKLITKNLASCDWKLFIDKYIDDDILDNTFVNVIYLDTRILNEENSRELGEFIKKINKYGDYQILFLINEFPRKRRKLLIKSLFGTINDAYYAFRIEDNTLYSKKHRSNILYI